MPVCAQEHTGSSVSGIPELYRYDIVRSNQCRFISGQSVRLLIQHQMLFVAAIFMAPKVNLNVVYQLKGVMAGRTGRYAVHGIRHMINS